MKKIKEKDIRGMELFCVIAALAADALCALYLLNVVQYHWILSFIQILAVLLHVALSLLLLVQKRTVLAAGCGLLAAAYLGSLIYYNI